MPVNQLIFTGIIGIDLQFYYSRTLLQEVFEHFKERKYYYGRTSANENEASFFLNGRHYFFS